MDTLHVDKIYIIELCDKFFSKKPFPNEYGVNIKGGKLYLHISLMKIVSFMRRCGKI